MSQIKVNYKRHLAKTISYRIISTSVGFLGMWWATGNIKIGAAFSVIELIYKPIQYYIHERVWYKWIKFGLEKTPEKIKKNPDISQNIIEKYPQPVYKEPKPTPSLKEEKKVLSYTKNR
jgi:uncharacterized membrane protein